MEGGMALLQLVILFIVRIIDRIARRAEGEGAVQDGEIGPQPADLLLGGKQFGMIQHGMYSWNLTAEKPLGT